MIVPVVLDVGFSELLDGNVTESEITNLDVLGLELIIFERPVFAGVFVAMIVEFGAVNFGTDPFLVVNVPGSLFIVLVISLFRLYPLVHFDGTFKPVRVLDARAKLVVVDILIIARLALA